MAAELGEKSVAYYKGFKPSYDIVYADAYEFMGGTDVLKVLNGIKNNLAGNIDKDNYALKKRNGRGAFASSRRTAVLDINYKGLMSFFLRFTRGRFEYTSIIKDCWT